MSLACSNTRKLRDGKTPAWFSPLAILVAALLVTAAPALAEHTRWWRQASFDDFAKGTAKGVALRSDGTLFLAPRFAEFADANLAFLLEIRADSKGNLYAAGGSNAKVVRLDASGKATTVFESSELAAQALAVDSAGNLYVGTSPDGKVYKVTPAGQSSVFFDPKTKYIWDLAVDKDGSVYVATGDTGKIFVVAPDGKGEVFYSSEQTHVRSLALDSNGNLLAGTEPSGQVLRVCVVRDFEKRGYSFAARCERQRLRRRRWGEIFSVAGTTRAPDPRDVNHGKFLGDPGFRRSSGCNAATDADHPLHATANGELKLGVSNRF